MNDKKTIAIIEEAYLKIKLSDKQLNELAELVVKELINKTIFKK